MASDHPAGGKGPGSAARRGRLAVDDVLLLAHGYAATLQVFMLDGHEQQGTGASGFFCHRQDGRGTACVLAHRQRMDEFQPAASPHAVAARCGRQETATGRVAIGAQPAGLDGLLEIRPMPQLRQSGARMRDRLPQRGADAPGQAVADLVRACLGAPGPVAGLDGGIPGH